MKACRDYAAQTKRRHFLEYIMIADEDGAPILPPDQAGNGWSP